jgi:hypothetical protein
LAYRPEDRWQSAEQFGEALASYSRRGSKRVTSLDVAKFLERFFQPEMDEHRQRLAQIMAGRSRPITNEDSWDGEMEADADRSPALAIPASASPPDWSSSAVDTLETRKTPVTPAANTEPVAAILEPVPTAEPQGKKRLPLPAPEATAVTRVPSAPDGPPLSADELRELLSPQTAPDPADVATTTRRKKTAPIPVPADEGTDPTARPGGTKKKKRKKKKRGRPFLWIGVSLLVLISLGAAAVISHQLGYQVPLFGPWLEIWLP